MTEALLEVDDLRTYFATEAGLVHAVDGVSFTIRPGERLALVGESGSGKSVTARSIMRLIDPPAGRIVSGSIWWRGRDLLAYEEPEMRQVRGKEIAMIFQDPMTSLDPVFTIGDQLAEAIVLHRGVSRDQARRQAIEALADVGVPRPQDRLNDYPHQFSGGMRQRVMIAIALACSPALLIADEPTTALDVTTQAQLLDLLADLADRRHMAVLLITHDLGIVAEFCERVQVMYAGKIVEESPVTALFDQPRHPYTEGLLGSISRIDRPSVTRLASIPGVPPSLLSPPPGCSFEPRCRYRLKSCTDAAPELVSLGAGRSAACYLAQQLSLVGS